MWAGDNSTLHATYGVQAARLGERFGDAQLMAFGRLGVGEALIRAGQVCAAGVALLDEVMVAVTAGEVSAIGVGHRLLRRDRRHARSSSTCAGPRSGRRRLASWCASQPDLVPYRGQCLVHRAEIMQLQGAWPERHARGPAAGARFRDVHAITQHFLVKLERLHHRRGGAGRLQEADLTVFLERPR